MKPVFIMMVGVPGSGKSTKAKELSIKYNAKIFSSDEYREIILGDENDQSKNELIFNALKKDLVNLIKSGSSAILDACNVNSKRRIASLKLLDGIEVQKIAHIMTTGYETCLMRDNMRNRRVGNTIIEKFISAYEIPSYYEGFDEIIFDGLENNSMYVYDPLVKNDILIKMAGFNQENPHHIYDLLEHHQNLYNLYPDECIEKQAASCHDFGKYFTKSYDDSGVAHYYSHANWSTFMLLDKLTAFKFENKNDLLECLFIINNHMKIRDIIRSTKAVKKYKKLWGTSMFGRLVEFMRCDNIASGTNDNYNQLQSTRIEKLKERIDV